jgi:ribokinase
MPNCFAEMATNSQPLIRVVGSINVDFTTVTPRVPGPGETLIATSLSVNAGGKGANQAVACGRASFASQGKQDVRVEMIGAVGRGDPYYKTLIEPTLEDAGVSYEGIAETDGQTGTATIIVDDGSNGENRILVVPGANYEGMRQQKEIVDKVFANPQPDFIVMQGEIPKETVFAILDYCKATSSARNTRIVFNPAPVFDKGIPTKYLSQVDVLIMNETELLQVINALVNQDLQPGGAAYCARRLSENIDLDQRTLDEISRLFHDAKVNTIIVTLGAQGAYYSQDGSDSGLVPGIAVQHVVDTTAAGDTFVGHFVTAFARWIGLSSAAISHLHDSPKTSRPFPVKEAIQAANAAAAKCVQRKGATQSIPWGYE